MLGVTLSRFRALCLAAVAIGAGVANAQSGTSFTYQGSLMDGGVPANGTYDMFFTPYADASGSQTVGTQYCADNVPVVGGRFAVVLPLRMPASGRLYLGLEVRQDQGSNCDSNAGLVLLSPRQEVTPAPQAVYAAAVREDASRIRGAMRLTANDSFQIFDGSRWRELAEVTALPVAISGTQSFNSLGVFSFVVPEEVTELYVAAWGASGGGAALGPGSTSIGTSCSTGTNFASGGGGGARGASMGARLVVTPGETLTILVGGGGGVRANQSGTAGGTTTIRRGTTNIMVVPGGGGGVRAANGVAMPSWNTVTCFGTQGIVGSPPGAAAAAPQLLGAGTVLTTGGATSGATGGEGPACWSTEIFNPPNPPSVQQGTCAAQPGGGGDSVGFSMGEGIGNVAAPGDGGRGASPTLPAVAGSDGRVQIYWF